MNSSTIRTILASALIISQSLALTSAHAAALGDPKLGQAYAEIHCASCHSIVPHGNTSPVSEATPFQEVADTGGMTRTALIVFLQSPHPTMPNLIVQGDNADNLISYILSLKTR